MADIKMWQDQTVRQQFMDRGQELFAQIKGELLETSASAPSTSSGDAAPVEASSSVVAIELESGDYFVGATLGQANDAARHRYLDQWLYFVRLDNPQAAIPLAVW